MANEGSTKPLDGWFFGTAKQYVVAPDGTEYWPRTEMNKRIEEAWKRESATAIELARVRGLLQLSKIRIGILVGRMRGCDEMNGRKHELSIPEGEAWMEEIQEALGAESADIGKLDAADEKVPSKRVRAKCGTCGGSHDES